MHPIDLEFNNDFNKAFPDNQMIVNWRQIYRKQLWKILFCMNHVQLKSYHHRIHKSVYTTAWAQDQLKQLSISSNRFYWPEETMPSFVQQKWYKVVGTNCEVFALALLPVDLSIGKEALSIEYYQCKWSFWKYWITDKLAKEVKLCFMTSS